MNLTTGARVWLVLGATDMRKSIDGLAVLVADHLVLDVFSGHLFAFCNRMRTIVKILYWDRNGFCLWHKRLEKSRFLWPSSEAEIVEMEHSRTPKATRRRPPSTAATRRVLFQKLGERRKRRATHVSTRFLSTFAICFASGTAYCLSLYCRADRQGGHRVSALLVHIVRT